MTNVKEKLSQTPAYQNLGRIANPEDFSKTCSEIFNQGGLDKNIPWTPHDSCDLSGIPAQFHPVILKAVASHEKDGGQAQFCKVHLNQGILPAGETFRVRGVHIDAWIVMYPKTDYPNNDVFIVSDALPTKFYLKPCDLPDAISQGDNKLNERLSAALQTQVDGHSMTTPAAYDLVRFDSYTIHTAQNAPEPTRRTFLMVRFF